MTARAREIEDATRRQFKRLQQAAQTAARHSEEVGEILQSQTAALAAQSEESVNSLGMVGNTLQHQSRQMVVACLAAAREVAELIDTLTEESNQIGGTATVAEERIRATGDMFHTRSEELAKESEAAFEQVSRVGETLQNQRVSLTSALTEASEKASEVGYVFSRQAETLTSASTEAENQAAIIRRNALDSRRDMFLRASKFVIEDLNSTAIDLNRLMDSEKSQKLWSKYSKGDRGIFVRGIISDDERQARSVISTKYEDDEEFRRYVQRYLDHFEKLLSEANESDPENLLSSTLLSADVGKLHLLLARAVWQLN